MVMIFTQSDALHKGAVRKVPLLRLKIIHPGMLYSLLSSTVTAGNFTANIEDRPRQRHYERLAPTSP